MAASTLGYLKFFNNNKIIYNFRSLEALLSFLKSSKIPVAYICIGEVSKNDVLKALKNVIKEDVSQRK